jgi:hypothetical protein
MEQPAAQMRGQRTLTAEASRTRSAAADIGRQYLPAMRKVWDMIDQKFDASFILTDKGLTLAHALGEQRGYRLLNNLLLVFLSMRECVAKVGSERLRSNPF